MSSESSRWRSWRASRIWLHRSRRTAQPLNSTMERQKHLHLPFFLRMAPATFQRDDGKSLHCAPSVVAFPAILSCSRHSSKPIPAILCVFPPFVKTHASRSVTTPCVSPYVTSHGLFLQFDGQVYWNSRLEKEHRRWGPLWPISRQYLANPISPRSHQPISRGDQF